MAGRPLRISIVGLRGVVGDGLTAAHVMDFAAAFGTFLSPAEPGRPVVIGRDPRASGVMLEQGVLAGLLACGQDCLRLGVVSTPVIQHTIQRLGAAGGVSIGASHNAVEWNALRFFGPHGTYLSTAEASELLDIYHLKKFAYAPHDRLGVAREDQGALDSYLDGLAAAYDFAALRRFRVIVDCCNGTSSLILRRMNERHGFSFILINERVESRQFAHEPATNAAVVGLQLAPLVRPVRADAGFLFDLDSDRIAMATELGEAVSEEMILPMLADHLLPLSAGKLVITNMSTTALLDEVAVWHNGRVLRVPVGRQAAMDALAVCKLDQVGLAGEGTGAVMMPRFRFVYDGIASMLGILSAMERRGKPLSEIVASYPKYSMLKGELPVVSPKIPALLMELQQKFPDGKADTSDGLRMDWKDRWFHVRVSQTEPVLRIICEQRGEPPRELFRHLMDEARRLE